MASIPEVDWLRMVAALGPEKAEQWRREQGVTVGDEPDMGAMPSPGADTVAGALSAPEAPADDTGLGVDRAALLRQLQGVQQEDIAAARDQREYRRRMFEQGRAELEKLRLGPSRSEQLFALAAAFSQPQQYKGFGGMMANVMPVLAQMTGQTRRADEERASALRKLEQDYMSDEQGLSRDERASRRQYLTSMLAATKPQARPRPLVNPISGEFVDPETMEVIPVSRGAPATSRTIGGITYYKGRDGEWYDNAEEAAQAGGPTQPASGGFQR